MLEMTTAMGPHVHDFFGERTLGQHLDARLAHLLRALGQAEKLPNAVRVARLLSRHWRHQPVIEGPRWASDITDDHTPFEFSLALQSSAETLRILTEARDPADATVLGSWHAANQINEELVAHGADLRSYGKVSDLFAPTSGSRALFSLWHSAILSGAERSDFKVYLNPAIHGAANAGRVLREALARLGVGPLWSQFARGVLRPDDLDEPMYLSLDLAAPTDARIKVYIAHRHARASDVVRASSACPGFDSPRTLAWLEELMGGTGPYLERPPITCFALRADSLELHSTTLHLPIRCYLPDDFEIARRVCKLLSFAQRVRYMRALTSMAERPLEIASGLQTYVSLRASPSREAVTVYLAPQVFSAHELTEHAVPAAFFSPRFSATAEAVSHAT